MQSTGDEKFSPTKFAASTSLFHENPLGAAQNMSVHDMERVRQQLRQLESDTISWVELFIVL